MSWTGSSTRTKRSLSRLWRLLGSVKELSAERPSKSPAKKTAPKQGAATPVCSVHAVAHDPFVAVLARPQALRAAVPAGQAAELRARRPRSFGCSGLLCLLLFLFLRVVCVETAPVVAGAESSAMGREVDGKRLRTRTRSDRLYAATPQELAEEQTVYWKIAQYFGTTVHRWKSA